jgi:plastocyanin
MRARLALVGLLSLLMVLVGADRAGAGGGCHDPDRTEVETATVAMEAMCIRPGVVHVQPGSTVTFTNRDSLTHNLYGAGWGHGDLLPGASTTETFTEPGTYAFTCTLHPGLVGAVVVDGQKLIAASSAAPATTDDGGLSLATVLGGLLIVLVGLGGTFTLGSRWR